MPRFAHDYCSFHEALDSSGGQRRHRLVHVRIDANAFVRPILKLLALPVRIVTLGVATLAINVFVVVGVLWLAEQLDLGVASDGWVPTLLGALIITVLSSIVSAIIKD